MENKISDQKNKSHEQWKPGDRSIHCPSEQVEQDIQQWNKRPSVVAWLFVLRTGVIALIFLLPGDWFFAGVYRLDTTWLVPRYLPVMFSVDRWALSHGPTVLMGLVSIFMGLSLAFIQLCPWLFGFGFAALIAKGFYSMTVRFLKMPLWSDYEQIFRPRDKP